MSAKSPNEIKEGDLVRLLPHPNLGYPNGWLMSNYRDKIFAILYSDQPEKAKAWAGLRSGESHQHMNNLIGKVLIIGPELTRLTSSESIPVVVQQDQSIHLMDKSCLELIAHDPDENY